MNTAESELAQHIKAARESLRKAMALAGAHALDDWKPCLRIADEALADIEERIKE